MKERWILVTGSARHLGRAIALRLAQEQFSILVHYSVAWDNDCNAVETVGMTDSALGFR